MNYKYIEKITEILLYICTFLVVFATGIPSSRFHSIQFFLISAALFCMGVFIICLIRRNLFEHIKRGVFLFLFAFVLTAISTVKYVFILIAKQEITFFTVYQMVIFAVFGFCVYVFCSEKRECINRSIFLFCITESTVILLCRNNFMLDLGIYRFLGIYENSNIQGLFSAVTIMLALYLLMADYGFKIISVFNFALSVSAVLQTYSRTSILAAFTGIVVFCLFSVWFVRRERRRIVFRFVVLEVIFVLFTSIMLIPDNHDKMSAVIIGSGLADDIAESDKEPDKTKGTDNNGSKNSVELSKEKEQSCDDKEVVEGNSKKDISKRFSLSSNDSSSLLHNLRFTIWEAYLTDYSNYFMFGTDYTLEDRPYINGKVRDPHNTILFTFFRYGVLSVGLLIVLLFVIGIGFVTKKKKTMYQISMFGCFCSIGVISLFNDLLNTPIYFFILSISYVIMQDEGTRDSSENILSNRANRVLQVFSSLNKGGAESRMMDIYREIDHEKVQFDFAVTSSKIEQQYFYKEIMELGGSVYEIKSWKTVGIMGYFSQWRQLLTENHYKAVHAHVGLESGIILYFAWLNDVEKRIAHARDSAVYDVSRMRRYYLKIARIMTNIFSTDKIYCSEEAALHIFGKNVLRSKKAYFLPNAIDIESFRPWDKDKVLEEKKELDLEKYDYIIGTVGNGRTVKNHIFLVKVFYEFLKVEPNSALLIVGDHEQDIEAKQYVKEKNIEKKVYFLGVREDIPDILQVFDCFILPSLTEGAPGSVIEAQAANIPCILSDTITRAVDVGIGMIKYLSLEASTDKWVTEILCSCQMERCDSELSVKKLRDYGYDRKSSIEQLMKIYEIRE